MYTHSRSIAGMVVLVCSDDTEAFKIDRWKPYFKDGKLTVGCAIYNCK